MRLRLLAAGVLLPAAVMASALPAQAGTNHNNDDGMVHADAVAGQTMPGAAPLRQLRSSTQKCAGTLVSKKTVSVGGKLVGELDVYANPKNMGTAIACFRHVGATKGKRLPTSVSIAAAKTATATKPAVIVVAYGNFVSWAGPAAVGGTKGHCIQAAGAIKYAGKNVVVESPVLCSK